MLSPLTEDEAKVVFFLIFEKYPDGECKNLQAMEKFVYRYLPPERIEEVRRIAKDKSIEASEELREKIYALADKFGDIIMLLYFYDKEEAQTIAKNFDEIARNLTMLSMRATKHSDSYYKYMNVAIEARELLKNYATYLK